MLLITFYPERDVLTAARHPFIVALHATFQTVDRVYFVMEYCAGGEFFRMLQRQPTKVGLASCICVMDIMYIYIYIY